MGFPPPPFPTSVSHQLPTAISWANRDTETPKHSRCGNSGPLELLREASQTLSGGGSGSLGQSGRGAKDLCEGGTQRLVWGVDLKRGLGKKWADK